MYVLCDTNANICHCIGCTVLYLMMTIDGMCFWNSRRFCWDFYTGLFSPRSTEDVLQTLFNSRIIQCPIDMQCRVQKYALERGVHP